MQSSRELKALTAQKRSLLEILLEGSHEGALLGGGLEATMTELGGGIDELEADLLQRGTAGVDNHGLTEGEHAFFGTDTASLDHEEVVLDNTVVGEATHGGDGLGGQVELSGGRLLIRTVGDAVDLLVHLSTMVETVLTSTGNSEHDTARMPGSDTGDLADTLVGLAGLLAGSPTGSDTLEAVALGDTDDIDVLVLLEDRVDSDLLLEVGVGPVDLVGNGSTVELDLHQVSLLLTSGGLAGLGVSKDTDDLAVLAHALKGSLHVLSTVGGHLLGVLGEGLALALVPVLVEAATEVIGQVLSPDGGQGAKTARSLDVASNTDNDNGGSLDDGDSLEDFLLVHLGSRTVEVTDDVGHTGLEAHEGSKVDGLAGIILGEGLDVTTDGAGALAGQETEGTVTGSFEFTMRLQNGKMDGRQGPGNGTISNEKDLRTPWSGSLFFNRKLSIIY